ncbi:alpha/beta hydrolase [Nostoc sp.]|uniref:alpha/beta hydrolase n=1 Tax=Nostoc sp. TaxID=1180 RepID=UPI002FFCFB86
MIGAVILVLSACGQPTLGHPSKPGVKVPAKLERFYNQKLTFGSCEGYATTDADAKDFANDTFKCARLEVPLDYQNPGGRTAQIALLRVPAKGKPSKRIGSLLLNPGGPGFSGMSYAATVAKDSADSPITKQFDLIGFDPRGVGASTPALDCFTNAEREADKLVNSINSGGKDYTDDQTRQFYQKCAERSGGEDVLAHVGTRDVVRDMDVLRAVLGDDKLNFLGVSYGTRLGAIYAETFPQNVRAMVLDGALDPTIGTIARRLILFAGFQRAFDNMAAFCAKTPSCPLGTDPKQATAAFQQIVRPLIDKPIITADGRKVTYTAVIDGVTTGLYGETGWRAVIQAITELKAGSGKTLLFLRDILSQRSAEGSYGNGYESLLAINCLDEERHTPEQESAMTRDIFKVAPFLNTGRPVNARDLCEHWRVKPTVGYPYAQNIKGLPKTLVVSVTRDPATPHEGGISLAKTLGASLLTVEGEQHGVALTGGNACVNNIVADYLIDLKIPADGARCVL